MRLVGLDASNDNAEKRVRVAAEPRLVAGLNPAAIRTGRR
jgi:hypothetical protein